MKNGATLKMLSMYEYKMMGEVKIAMKLNEALLGQG
jgi:hypothetical protein